VWCRRCPPGSKPWRGFSSEALQAWGPYLALALPSTAMMCLEWWASEALTLLAGAGCGGVRACRGGPQRPPPCWQARGAEEGGCEMWDAGVGFV
jgi:hypothetical protein